MTYFWQSSVIPQSRIARFFLKAAQWWDQVEWQAGNGYCPYCDHRMDHFRRKK